MPRFLLFLILCFVSMLRTGSLWAQAPVAPNATPPHIAPYAAVETHRIRITNVQGGAIEVSDDQGRTWYLVGRVMIPATQCLMGYLASGYSQQGTVSATAVHGIRIRTGGLGTAYPKLINILPVEFVQTSDSFGGQVSGASGIYTNIPAGYSIFRELSPHAGDPVYVRSGTRDRVPLPLDYNPQVGDIFTIVVNKPVNGLREVDFDNNKHGAVHAIYEDGKSVQICQVIKPVTGVGRFDGTSFTGVGAVNTNHSGVITVSTAPVTTSTLPEGVGPERRGGFQIEPSYHNSQSDEAWYPMIMVIGNPGKLDRPDLEGTPPLFHGYLDLAFDPKDPQHSWVAQIQTAKSNGHWLPMRQLIGYHTWPLRDVTEIRLIRASYGGPAWLHQRIVDDAQNYDDLRLQEARDGRIGVSRGKLTMRAAYSASAAYAALYVDGQLKSLTNNAPFDLSWDTTDSPDGEYLVELRTEDNNGRTLKSIHKVIWVDNRRQVAER